MTVFAYDSARPQLIPADPAAVFPYSDGRYRWSNSKFPRARYRYITALGDPDADIADFEPGCIWPFPRLKGWALERLARHGASADLTVYTDRSNFPLAAGALRGLNWHLFLATLDGTQPTSWAGKPVRSVQFTDRNGLYDISRVFDEGWLNTPK